MKIVYHPGRENDMVDALSRNPCSVGDSGNHLELGVQLCQVRSSEREILELLQVPSEAAGSTRTLLPSKGKIVSC